MPTKPRFFDTSLYYHVYNCGVEKRNIFITAKDYQRFLETINFYLYDQPISYAQFQNLNEKVKQVYLKLNPKGLKRLRVKLISYCLMPNHFHFLIKPAKENGITRFLSDTSNSYTRYFNIKNERIGSLLQGPFKSKEISSEESLLQVTRYIHLNPVNSSKTNISGSLKPENYPFSSYREWINLPSLNPKGLSLVDKKEILNWLSLTGKATGETKSYKKFIESEMNKNPKAGIEGLIF